MPNNDTDKNTNAKTPNDVSNKIVKQPHVEKMSKKDYKKARKQIRKELQSDMNKIGQVFEKKYKDLEVKRKVAIEEMPDNLSSDEKAAFFAKLDKLDKDALDESIKESESLSKGYNEKLRVLHKKAGFEVPEPVSFEVITPKAARNNAAGESSTTSLFSILGYIMFFLVTPLGMAIFEDHVTVGALLILGGLLSLPTLFNYIIRKFTWVHPLNVLLISQVFIVAGLIKLIMLVSGQ